MNPVLNHLFSKSFFLRKISKKSLKEQNNMNGPRVCTHIRRVGGGGKAITH